MRCLFIRWNNDTSSQFTVPDTYRLPTQTRTTRTLLHRHNRLTLPDTLTLYDDDTHTELYLDVSQIRSAYLITIAADRQIIETPN
jgi:hypothetical protein